MLQQYWNQGKGSAYLSKKAKDLSTTFKTGNGFWVVNPQRNFKKHLHDGHNRIALSMMGIPQCLFMETNFTLLHPGFEAK